MRVVETIADLKRERRLLKEPVGFVPTMGYLHEGHLSLVRLAGHDNSSVAISIFVNPTQFGSREDLTTYPRDMSRDLAMLEETGADFVFAPKTEEMYPEGFSSWIEVEKVTDHLEGAHRPNHFRGVTTVVAKLFNLIEPNRAYFGQKDAQQVLVIKRMIADLGMNLEIKIGPTVRESDGLAMSSRNTYLNPQEREAALVIYQSLLLAWKLWHQGDRNAQHIRKEMTCLIQREPLATVDYVSVADADTLTELDVVDGKALVSLAVKIGTTRLIDNVVLKSV
jgi:pantoate--beta-alanine ligase